MGLLEMKSKLSIKESPNTGLGESKLLKTVDSVPKPGVPSNLVDTGKSFSGQGFGASKLISTAPPIPSEGVDYFTNLNATGFTLNRGKTGAETDFILNDTGGPIIPQTSYLDIKGDFSSIFSPTNPAYPNIYNTDTSTPSPLQAFSVPTNNPVDRFGSFVPPYNQPNPYISVGTGISFGVSDTGGFGGEAVSLFNLGLTGGPTTPANTNPPGGPSVQSFISKLLILHENGREPTFGFTRPGISLSERYAQQPDNFRGIGQRWNVDRVELRNVPPIVERGVEVLNQLASPAVGRDIGIFTNQYKASINRTLGFSNAGSIYALKQTFLHRQNKYDRRYTQALGLEFNSVSFDNNFRTGLGEFAALVSDSGLIDLNPRVYNEFSIFSIPGVSGMMFNRNGRNIQDVAGLGGAAIDVASDTVKRVGSKIVDSISQKAIALSQKKQTQNIIFKNLGEFGQSITDGLGALGGAIGGRLGKIEFGKIRGSNQSTQPLSDIFGGVKLKKPSIVQKTQQFAKDFGGQVASDLVTLGKTAATLTKKTQEFAQDFASDVGVIGKAQASRLDPRAFEDVKVDRVNLIPYKSTKYKEDDHESLDLIPFRFIDARTDNPIVFRAILSGITDSFSPEYASERYVGRPDNVYVYQGTNREISFNFDVYPKSDAELVTLWEKLNYLAGLTYPHWDTTNQGMIAPFSKLKIGDMYNDVPGYISSLTYTIQDNGTWEVDFAKLPKYVQVACNFIYIGDRLPSATQKHFDCDWIGPEEYSVEPITAGAYNRNQPKAIIGAGLQNQATSVAKDFLRKVGL